MSDPRILVIIEEGLAANELTAGLAPFGYSIVTVPPGSDVIAAAERMDPNLVVMDLGPADSRRSLEIAAEVRERRPIPIVFISHESEEATLRRLPLTQPYRCVIAPYTGRELRLHIELALREYESMTTRSDVEEGFFSVSIDLLCCLDFNGYFRRLNPAWERTLGYTRAELMAKPFMEFVHPDDRERTLEQNRQVRGGKQAIGFENRYLCKDGSYRWLLWNAAADGSQRVIYSVARDITLRKQAEEEREQLVQALKSAFAELRMLREILPICSYCKKVRDDEDYWMSVDSYISEHTNTRFSHGICPECYEKEVAPQHGPLKEE